MRKDSKTKDARIEALKLELALTREQQIATSEELQQVVGQRDRLIEKVERLHAEKHQVEARYLIYTCMCECSIPIPGLFSFLLFSLSFFLSKMSLTSSGYWTKSMTCWIMLVQWCHGNLL